ncbi:flagellar motor stator protein MotA [Falsirhodobacter sp. alg1]|uniref:flagellar motor stator protein MotA n=1 Tax=Falsirhodobacter sp. alg1 TaxID=1472418 RepID=UPI0005EFA25B|nr:flagellar motor stator protein MotA [Falsirhodobacter sp. alg1]
MLGIVGIVVIFVMVFGGYSFAGGKMGVILHSLPYELAMIGGAALGAFLLGNNGATAKATLRDLKKVFKGASWSSEDYRDLLCLLYELVRIARANPIALEEHIENPESSSVFARYPKIRADHEAVDLICDTLRAASMNYDDPHQVEAVLDKRMEASAHHAQASSHALQTLADALPALGIVAAVLGVIKTMASIDQPPEVLGGMIGGALVGTFLGVFLAYGFVGPAAMRLHAIAEEEGQFYTLIREVLVANLYAHPANICIEVGRQNTPHHVRPNFNELDAALRGLKEAA